MGREKRFPFQMKCLFASDDLWTSNNRNSEERYAVEFLLQDFSVSF